MSKQRACQRAARTLRSPVVVSDWNGFLDTVNAANRSGNGQCERHTRREGTHLAQVGALAGTADDWRGNATSHLLAG
ncbi:MAG: hypothetical protein E6J11_18535 [Chloroflexi bacterium]|nr:MAG: hypothetical protein E6J11_18535 [Chloroflexota bacterium]